MDARFWYWNTSELESFLWMFSFIEDFWILKIPYWSHAFHLQYQWCFRRWFWWPAEATQMVCNQSIQYSPCTIVFWFSAYTKLNLFLHYACPHQTNLSWKKLEPYPQFVCVLLLRISWLWERRFCPKSQVFWNLKGPSPFAAVSWVIFRICRAFGWRMEMGACCSWATTKKTLILELMM